MVLNKENETVLQDKLALGEHELQKLKDALKTIEDGFAVASVQYGSKLAGSDGGDEIRKKIRIAEARLDPLRKVLRGDLDISEQASINRINLICGLDRAIGILQKEREKANEESFQVGIVRGVLEDTLRFVD